MSRDKRLLKLADAWNVMQESLVARTPIEGPAIIESSDALLQKFKDLITIEDSEVEINIKLGWKTIATIYEDGGQWFPYVDNKPIVTLGHPTKEAAFQKLIEYFIND